MRPEDIIIKPIITEKSNDGLQDGKYTFKVNKKADLVIEFIQTLYVHKVCFDFLVIKIVLYKNCKGYLGLLQTGYLGLHRDMIFIPIQL